MKLPKNLEDALNKYKIVLIECEKILSQQEYEDFKKIITPWNDSIQPLLQTINRTKTAPRNIVLEVITNIDDVLIEGWKFLQTAYSNSIDRFFEGYTIDHIKHAYPEHYTENLKRFAKIKSNLSQLAYIREVKHGIDTIEYKNSLLNAEKDTNFLRTLLSELPTYKTELERVRNHPKDLYSTSNNDGSVDRANDLSLRSQKIIGIVSGILFLVCLLILAIFFPSPTPFQYVVFRITLALAAASFSVTIPGFLEVTIPNIARGLGGFAVFLIIYFFSPAALVTSTKPIKIKVYGNIYSSKDKSPISNAEVILEKNGSKDYTDSDGRFLLELTTENIPAYTSIRINAIGHISQNSKIELSDDKLVNFFLRGEKETTTETIKPAISSGRKVNPDHDRISEVISAGYTRAVFTITDREIELIEMHNSLARFRSVVEKNTPFVVEKNSQKYLADILSELDEIDRYRTNYPLIDKAKINIINRLNSLCKVIGCRFTLPNNFIDKNFFEQNIIEGRSSAPE